MCISGTRKTSIKVVICFRNIETAEIQQIMIYWMFIIDLSTEKYNIGEI
jgi:hypothetical protein